MKIPKITGIIRRRVLLNYRVDPGVIEKQLPANFCPKRVDGYAIAGVCLIRLEEIRPKGLPKTVGISSENSAHRIAVVWQDEEESKEGVFVPRRDTDSRINSLAGGRIFPGVHHLSQFEVLDSGGNISMKVMTGEGGEPLIEFQASEAEVLPKDSVFASVEESSDFFEAGCIGYSSRPDSCKLDGIQLKTIEWKVKPLEVHSIQSAYFDDQTLFPSGSIKFDHALLMRDIPHEWHSEAEMIAENRSVAVKTS